MSPEAKQTHLELAIGFKCLMLQAGGDDDDLEKATMLRNVKLERNFTVAEAGSYDVASWVFGLQCLDIFELGNFI